MYNEQQILSRCKEFVSTHFGMEFNDKIRISSRMTRSWGSCNYIKITKSGITTFEIKELVFAHKMFRDPQYTNATLDKIILHELAHWRLLKDNYDAKHNKDFKRLCESIGGDLGYASTEITECGLENLYIIICSSCHKFSCTRTNSPSEKLMNNYISNCCKAKLKNIGRHTVQLENIDKCIDKIINNYKLGC